MSHYLSPDDLARQITAYRANPQDSQAANDLAASLYLLADGVCGLLRLPRHDRDDQIQEAVLACLRECQSDRCDLSTNPFSYLTQTCKFHIWYTYRKSSRRVLGTPTDPAELVSVEAW